MQDLFKNKFKCDIFIRPDVFYFSHTKNDEFHLRLVEHNLINNIAKRLRSSRGL
jgi:hypothetical protein